jgi:O-antigen/teichoic acid export membrane protein
VATIASVPALVTLAALSKLVLAVLGPRWSDGSVAIKILCAVAVMQPILYFAGPLMQAVAKPHYLAIIEWIHAAMQAGALVLAGEWLRNKETSVQVAGMATARFAAVALLMIPIMYLLWHLIGLRLSSVARTVTPSLLSAAAAMLVAGVLGPRLQFLGHMPVRALAIEASAAGLAAIAVLLLADHGLRDEAGKLWKLVTGNRTASEPLKTSIESSR